LALVALMREVSASLPSCELTYFDRDPIDVARASAQHAEYRRLLANCGTEVRVLPADDGAPDCCFIEDTAVVVDEIAVMAPLGAPSRRRESDEVAKALAAFRPVTRLALPATLDGGDVVVIGRHVFVGLSTRTNAAGVEGLAQALEPFGYRVVPTEVRGCLHLKTAMTAVDDETLLANPALVDPPRGLRTVAVPDDEPSAGNVLRLGDVLCMAAVFPRTTERLRGQGRDVRVVDISELMKAEAGMTCLSLVFRG
jgi:dimethylargininase